MRPNLKVGEVLLNAPTAKKENAIHHVRMGIFAILRVKNAKR